MSNPTIEPRITNGFFCMDLDVSQQLIRSCYENRTFTDSRIQNAMLNSRTFAMRIDGKQIGFARVVTDWTIFSTIAEFAIVPDKQHQGFGRILMEAVLKDPSVAGTTCVVASRKAHEFFAKFGFVPVNDWVGVRTP